MFPRSDIKKYYNSLVLSISHKEPRFVNACDPLFVTRWLKSR